MLTRPNVTTTPAREPILKAEWLHPSLHITAMYTPGLRDILHLAPVSVAEWGILLLAASTLLMVMAGLERPDGGEIEIGGTIVSSPEKGIHLPTEKRDIGMVFQSYAIWPHMNVFQNVAFPLVKGRRRVPKAQVAEKARQALQLVQLDGLEDRPATDLSGGQQQRVAMARAIVTEPKILLMDEPLSNLDARLREQMRLELKKITLSVGVTTLYVTHDQAEALSLGDKVCVMNLGDILQVGTPKEVYSRPENLFVAQFVGEMNFVRAKVAGSDVVDSPLGKVRCRVPESCRAGSEVTLAIRPEHLGVARPADRSSNGAEGKIVNKNYLGDSALLEVEVNGIVLRVKLPGDVDFALGDKAKLVLPPDRWRVYS